MSPNNTWATASTRTTSRSGSFPYVAAPASGYEADDAGTAAHMSGDLGVPRDGEPSPRAGRRVVAGRRSRRRGVPGRRASSPPAGRGAETRHRPAIGRGPTSAGGPSPPAADARTTPTRRPQAWLQLAQPRRSRPSRTAPRVLRRAGRGARPGRRARRPVTPARVADGLLALSLHDFARPARTGRRPTGSPGDSDALAILVDATSSSAATTRPPARADARPPARLHRPAPASYLRELHGDLPGAAPCSRPSRPPAPADTASSPSSSATLLAPARPHRGRAAFERSRTRAQPGWPPDVGPARVCRGGRPPRRPSHSAPARRPLAPPAAATLLGELQRLPGRRRRSAADSFALVRANEPAARRRRRPTVTSSRPFRGRPRRPGPAVELAQAGVRRAPHRLHRRRPRAGPSPAPASGRRPALRRGVAADWARRPPHCTSMPRRPRRSRDSRQARPSCGRPSTWRLADPAHAPATRSPAASGSTSPTRGGRDARERSPPGRRWPLSARVRARRPAAPTRSATSP